MWRTVLTRYAGPVIAVVLFAAALATLHHILRDYHYHDILRSARAVPRGTIMWALMLALAAYLTMTCYDALALAYTGHGLPYGQVALASFVSYALSMNLGFAPLTGGAARYRLYSSWGLSAVDVAKIVAFCGLTFWFGFLALAGLVFLLEPRTLPDIAHFRYIPPQAIGLLFIVAVVAFFVWTARPGTALRWGNWEVPHPPLKLSLTALLVAGVDWALAAAVLYALLPPSVHVSFPAFLSFYLLAQLLAVVSSVPGGLGVFESSLLLLMRDLSPPAPLVGALLLYRVVYYLLPFGLAVGLMAGHEVLQRRALVRRVADALGDWMTPLVPQVLALTTFVAGAVLLFSGATPTLAGRLHMLRGLLPLPVVEVSHFVGSVSGVGLLLLAHGLQRRVDAAYWLSVALLVVGVAASLLKGLDYEEAITLTVMLLALLPCRTHFHRRAAILGARPSATWGLLVVMVLAGAAWLGLFSYKHVEYSNDLWWRLAFHAEAPRFLRASIGVAAVLVAVGGWRLLRPVPPRPTAPTGAAVERAAAIVAQQPLTYGNFALLGDKLLLFNEEQSAFIMYGVQGRTWLALGNPVGPTGTHAELIWQYREMVDRYGGWTVFHDVAPADLPLYLDSGLAPVKIGEAARVPLTGFTLEGGARKPLRQAVNRYERDGATFEIVPREGVPALLPELRAISDAWLEEKRTREKHFSIGFYDEHYLRRYAIAIVRHQGRLVAFANLWEGAQREELSIDLMRYVNGGHKGVMDYLFTQLMLWGATQGYRWFDLGVAPLSGLESHPLAPLWHRVGQVIFTHGDFFYNFEGLRQYKQKFEPVWEPRYLVYPGGWLLPRILLDAATLVSGGIKGLVAK